MPIWNEIGTVNINIWFPFPFLMFFIWIYIPKKFVKYNNSKFFIYFYLLI